MTQPSNNLQELQRKREAAALELAKEKEMFSLAKLSELSGYNEQMLVVIQKSVAKNTSPAEFAYFLSMAKGMGLNPLNKEIWCYKNNSSDVLIFTGRDGFLKKNKENPNFRGMRSSEVCEKDTFSIDMVEGKVSHVINGGERGKILGAYCIVKIEGQIDTVKWLDFDEFDLKQAKWKSAPKMMIRKCAESHALKEASGMTGIQAEEAFIVKNDIVVSEVQQSSPEEKSAEKEEERILKLIESLTKIDKLKELEKECKTTELSMAYDKKFKELTGI